MDSSEQAALREVVRDFCGKHAGPGAWDRLTGELGLTGLAVPECHGGAGAGLAEVAVAVEETGRVLLPAPYLSTALAGAVLSEGGAAPGDFAAAQFLPGIASGALRAAFAFSDSVQAAPGGRLTGVAHHVLDGAEADLFIVRAGDALFAVRAADAVVTPAYTLDETRSQARVSFSDAPGLAAGSVIEGGAAERAEDLLRVMLAVESAGAAAHCLDVTVGYLKTRVQFGRPIGAFQALRHRCADLAVEVASARATAYAAVRAASLAGAGSPGGSSAGSPAGSAAELAVLGPLAKRHCVDVFWHAAAEMIQLHGGIGFTWEHEAHRYLKRAKTSQLLHGTPAELRRLVSQRAGLC